jgi:hypothetical protein
VRRKIASTIFATTLALGGGLLAAPAAQAISVQPNGCQAASATLTLETTSRGHTYDCSGWNYDAAGETAYYVSPGGWSGVLYTYSGSTEYDYYFCDFHNFNVGYHTVKSIYLSATKESWC